MAHRPRKTLDSLWEQIQSNLVVAIDQRCFVPPSSLGVIFTPAAVTAAVAELDCDEEDRLGLAADIVRHSSSITTFAILVRMRHADAVVNFRRHCCLGRLPLAAEVAQVVVPEIAVTFLQAQWEFLPYHFRPGMDTVIPASQILPFIWQDRPITGGFGSVVGVAIHPTLQDFYPHDTSKVVVIRKTLREDIPVSEDRRKVLYRAEKRCLQLINHPPHPNIVPLLGSYIHHRKHCLLFPRLDMNLAEFFRRPTPYGNFGQTSTYIAALHGLASALERAHNIRISDEAEGIEFQGIGYHHDLRPENILVTTDKLWLADFGMGRVRPQEDGSTTHIKGVKGDYAAPEAMDEDFVPLDVGRAIDVWAFGCLAAEIITYAYRKMEGLEEFRTRRFAPTTSSNETTSFFYDNMSLKQSVRDWVTLLADSSDRPALDQPLSQLILSLLVPVGERPKISHARQHLGHLSLKAHVFQALDTLTKLVDLGGGSLAHGALMNLWFERERLHAFARVLDLFSPSLNSSAAETSSRQSKEYLNILSKLLRILQECPDSRETCETELNGTINASKANSPTPRVHEASLSPILHPEPPVTEVKGSSRASDDQSLLSSDVQSLVQELWRLLPEAEVRKAERAWVHSMLDRTKNVNQLANMEQQLASQDLSTYQHGAALLMIKKVRLEMMQSPTIRAKLDGLMMDGSDIPKPDRVSTKTSHGHKLGTFKATTRVLIETMLYDPAWEKIPPSERALVMAQKAKCFNVRPQPPNLRVLECLGFFERGAEGGMPGYSFVYKLPLPATTGSAVTQPTRAVYTLLSLLPSHDELRSNPHSQPNLGDKFKLASALAGFLVEFHGTGWLHENFHSNNMIYFGDAPHFGSKAMPSAQGNPLESPYIVGLNKSRPGGDAWHTQGPAAKGDFLNYRHPEYETTRRFRRGYDYYALGLVLLEIGLWMPLSEVSRRGPARTMSPHQLRKLLLEKYVPRLGYRMGQAYRDVAMLLIADGLDLEPQRIDPDPVRESAAYGGFLELVVDPLERLASADI